MSNEWVNKNPISVILIFVGILLQCIGFIITLELTAYNVLSFISGLFGVFAVVLCSERKLISYVFGIAQLLTFLIIVWHDALYAKIAENVFYLVTMIIGIFIWNQHYTDDRVETKHVSKRNLAIIISIVTGLSLLVGYCLTFTNDVHPYIDAFTTLPAFVAQILMIFRYREQWIFWFIIDVGCIVLWLIVGNWFMVAQYIFWTINCIYGWKNWK